MRVASIPTLDMERAARDRGARVVAGLDEVGRGAWAGPVVAAAVVLPADRDDEDLLHALAGVRDSKALDPAARCAIYADILRTASAVGVGSASPSLIDAIGIARANDLAMLRALAALPRRPDFLVVDGYPLRLSTSPQQAVVRGDQTVLSIAAASIVAKVHRDAAMIALSLRAPGYGFDAHKGYGTAAHRAAIQRLGTTVHHRLTWAPMRDPAHPLPPAPPHHHPRPPLREIRVIPQIRDPHG